MTAKEFITRLANGTRDLLQEFINILEHNKIPYCIIGGLAVNAYTEPVVSLDLDVVVAAKDSDQLIALLPKDFTVKIEKHSVNISTSFSDLRIQLQSDDRYQTFIGRAQRKKVLGYVLPVASLEDVLQGKLWAYTDSERRSSKRQKDLADIMRLVESNPEILSTPAGKIAKEIIIKL